MGRLTEIISPQKWGGFGHVRAFPLQIFNLMSPEGITLLTMPANFRPKDPLERNFCYAPVLSSPPPFRLHMPLHCLAPVFIFMFTHSFSFHFLHSILRYRCNTITIPVMFLPIAMYL